MKNVIKEMELKFCITSTTDEDFFFENLFKEYKNLLIKAINSANENCIKNSKKTFSFKYFYLKL